MMKKLLLIILLLVSIISLTNCANNIDNTNTNTNTENTTKKREINLNFDYLYQVRDGFTFDETLYILDDNQVKLPDLSGYTIGEVKYCLDKLGVLYEIEFDHSTSRSENDYNQFVGYSHDLKSGDVVKLNQFFYAYVTELELTYSNIEEVKLDMNDVYGKSFINDGIGQVTLIRAVDGDTAWFKDIETGTEFKLRFYCIDTPESTIDHDPWGQAASNFTKKILTSASVIVCEQEPGHVKDVYDRYLGYVWADGVLLNLLLVNEAYTNAASSDSKYQVYFTESMMHAMKTGRRFYGEIDAGFDYNKYIK